MVKEKMICTCPRCKTQFFENKIKVDNWSKPYEREYNDMYNYVKGVMFIIKGRDTIFHCSACKINSHMFHEEKTVGKKKVKIEIKKPWWKLR